MKRRTILFTDLDETLFEAKSGSFEPALPALQVLRERGITLVPCSFKTFQETLALQQQLGMEGPSIVENGGAIYYRPGELKPVGLQEQTVGEWRRVVLGLPYRALVAHLEQLARDLGIQVLSFANLTPEAIADRFSLPLDMARAAKAREFDEVFEIEGGEPSHMGRLASLANAIGLAVTEGSRFLHLSGASDQGRAVRAACLGLKRSGSLVRSIGLASHASALPMLAAVDLPVVVMRHGGAIDRQLQEGIPDALLAPGSGPLGWNAAVMQLLEEGHLA